MRKILFLEPVFKEVIWGGNKLATDYGYKIPSDTTGECWAVSAHKSGDCTFKNEELKGKTLSWLWDNHREVFGNAKGDIFPLLIKIIDAKKDLSIQVHPNDEYAKANENGALGKTECWYILDCEEGATIIIGHNAKSKEELKQMIEEKRWKDLIREIPIKKGDFFQITPGTVHAIKGGTVILETQQNSDITYRLYDYDRLSNGKPRELHIKKSIDVIKCPYIEEKQDFKIIKKYNYDEKDLVKCEFYEVKKIDIHGEETFIQNKPFEIVSVIEGKGFINDFEIKKGDHFIIPFNYGEYKLKGNMELIISNI